MASRHLLIAGTGRAGTSFLVRYLTDLGLDTHLARQGEAAYWDAEANAGLEDNLLAAPIGALPYVVKSPWLYEYVDELLRDRRFAIDGVILPVRDLAEAAASRVVLEMRAIHAEAPWMAERERGWASWAHTPGGVLYSLEPLDQARLLAVGFHRVVQRLAEAEVPIALLSFPRIVQDGAYLFRRLRDFLPSRITPERAMEAHRHIADAAKVRVGRELPRCAAAGKAIPEVAQLESAALRREVVRLRAVANASTASAERSAAEAAALRKDLAASCNEAARRAEACAAAREAIVHVEAKLAAVQAERTSLAAELASERAHSAALAQASAELAALRAALDAVRTSRSWRFTAPMRLAGAAMRRLLHGQTGAAAG